MCLSFSFFHFPLDCQFSTAFLTEILAQSNVLLILSQIHVLLLLSESLFASLFEATPGHLSHSLFSMSKGYIQSASLKVKTTLRTLQRSLNADLICAGILIILGYKSSITIQNGIVNLLLKSLYRFSIYRSLQRFEGHI